MQAKKLPNHQRTAAARATLLEYLRITKRDADTLKTDLIDLVTDLFHLADSKDIDYASIVFCARENFLAEQDARKRAARKHGRRIKGDTGKYASWMDAVHAQAQHDKNLPDTPESDREFPDGHSTVEVPEHLRCKLEDM